MSEAQIPQVKIKLLHPNANIPTRCTEGAAGYDLYIPQDFTNYHNKATGSVTYYNPITCRVENTDKYIASFNTLAFAIPLGIALEIPSGWEAQVRPRSSTAVKRGIHVVFATIDSDYRGEISMQVIAFNNGAFSLRAGERIAQLVFQRVPQVELVLSDVLSDTPRGAGGFGSTGR